LRYNVIKTSLMSTRERSGSHLKYVLYALPHATHLRSHVRVNLTDVDTGKVMKLKAGDSAVLELGSSVRWDVIETVTKFFVIVSH